MAGCPASTPTLHRQQSHCPICFGEETIDVVPVECWRLEAYQLSTGYLPRPRFWGLLRCPVLVSSIEESGVVSVVRDRGA